MMICNYPLLTVALHGPIISLRDPHAATYLGLQFLGEARRVISPRGLAQRERRLQLRAHRLQLLELVLLVLRGRQLLLGHQLVQVLHDLEARVVLVLSERARRSFCSIGGNIKISQSR